MLFCRGQTTWHCFPLRLAGGGSVGHQRGHEDSVPAAGEGVTSQRREHSPVLNTDTVHVHGLLLINNRVTSHSPTIAGSRSGQLVAAPSLVMARGRAGWKDGMGGDPATARGK